MTSTSNTDGKQLLAQLEQLLTDIQRYSQTVDRYVITSTTDLFGTITSVSTAFCEISGYSEDELIGRNHNLVRHPDMPQDLYRDLWDTIRSDNIWQGEVKNLKKNGQFYWVDVSIEPLKDLNNSIIGYLAVRQDITAKKIVEQLTITDELTGAYNRRYFNQTLPTEVIRAKRDGYFLGFLMIDADNFKNYNDTYGHQAGDEVLKAITSTLQGSFKRAGDFIFRIGGEEFVALYRIQKIDDAEKTAERARQAMFDLNIEHSGNSPHNRVTLSMGLMTMDSSQDYIIEEIYKYADQALYHAKENGRNCIEVCDNSGDIEFL
ncbi:MAG: two-component system, cell cycle response regulator [Thiomicrorhabdus sp.]|nr:MAG: two-component system, cell cycle response regulator [Thiomicrorhabdus sp.]